jgi:hypothetical protein
MVEEEEKETGDIARINIRLTPGQYDLMRRLGGALGFDRDSTTAKHFFVVGMQSSMSALATSQGQDSTVALRDFMAMMKEESSKADEREAKGRKSAA